MQYESWVDRQIREAIERGEFDNLPGAGKAIHLDDDPNWWIKAKLESEDLSGLLPTPLALKREVEQLPQVLAEIPTESQVRDLVEDLNRRIKESYLRDTDGPRIVVGLVDAEVALSQWRERA